MHKRNKPTLLKKSSHGFAIVETVIILLVVAVVGFAGYKVDQRHHKSTLAAESSQGSGTTPAAINSQLQDINSTLAQQNATESNADSQSTSSDTSAATSANDAASNLGVAYNESSF